MFFQLKKGKIKLSFPHCPFIWGVANGKIWDLPRRRHPSQKSEPETLWWNVSRLKKSKNKPWKNETSRLIKNASEISRSCQSFLRPNVFWGTIRHPSYAYNVVPLIELLLCTCKKTTNTPTLNGGRRGGVWIVLFSKVIAVQHRVETLFRHGFKWLQHCSNIAMLCCTKNRIVLCNIIFKGTASFWWVLHIYFLNYTLFVFQGSWSGDSSAWFCTGGYGWLVH